MIAFAKKQNLKEEPNTATMIAAIGETWYSKNCPYCKEYYRQGCDICPLNTPGSSCCNGIWVKMNYAKTWREWIKYAKKVIKYIKENG